MMRATRSLCKLNLLFPQSIEIFAEERNSIEVLGRVAGPSDEAFGRLVCGD